jgi:hypothetical protein
MIDNNVILGFILLMLVLMSPAFAIVAVALFNKHRRRRGPTLRAFPVVDGPGTFQVFGVERDSRTDWSSVIEADSSANAQVKAELEGIVVTQVRRVS